MKRAIPVLVLSVAGLIPVFRYEAGTPSSADSSSQAPAPSVAGTVFSGTTVSTEKGDVQVQITYVGGRITAVKMLKQPDHPQTTAAVPKLVASTLKAQSAQIDTVSGATLTSNGYKKSLQAALDAAAAAGKKGDASPSPAASAAGSQVVAGSVVGTEKGDVQVEVTFEGDEITAVRMLKAPDFPQTKNAVPKLVAETLREQSAEIDTVSGATITSGGYKKSLQAALDAAASPAAAGSQVVAGSVVETEKGDVQVEVTFQGDEITAVRMLKAPDFPQTKNAVPKLVAETLREQSAEIDTVSGATITSGGYKESLQAALDAKG
ncbi:FMN-binding protein [Streptomyces sp. S6]